VSDVVRRRITTLLTQRYPENGEGRSDGAAGAADPPVGAARTGTGGVPAAS
jgi:dTMP kinase